MAPVAELDSLAALEAHLRRAGFFEGGADGLAADVYLGYRLAEPLRRAPWPSPPEPCPLPAAACRIRAAAEPAVVRPGNYRIGPWERTWDPADYRSAIASVRSSIAAGDVYQ